MPVRTSVYTMSADRLKRLRRGLQAMMDLPDERGYQFLAGLHGLPLPSYCQHGSAGPVQGLLFLPWHRAYLYFFELALQDQEPGATVPWWNWSSPRARREGVPPTHASPTTPEGDPNPLYDSAVLLAPELVDLVRRELPHALTDDDPPRTRREPESPDELPRAKTVRAILNAPSYEDLALGLENVHNQVHVWFRASMTEVAVAAFDPIFWSHHAMIDRLWHIWQLRHPGALPPSAILDTALPPFPVTVRQMVDVSALGYEYSVRTR